MKQYSVFMLGIYFFFSVDVVIGDQTKRGEKVFNQHCSRCHSVVRKKMGPMINEMSNDSNKIRQAIENGGELMPGYVVELSAKQIESLVEFIIDSRRAKNSDGTDPSQ